MMRRNAVVRHCGRGYMALSVVAASLVGLAYSTLASQLVDLSEDFTAETIESMKADMSVHFLEDALLQATVSLTAGGGDSGDLVSRGGCSVPGEEGCSWPSYSLTDADGVVHTCTVRQDPPEKRPPWRKRSTGRDVAMALDQLDGRCATLKHQYWSYRWCHKEEVIQFHENEDGTKTTIELGKHARTEVKRASATPAKADPAGAVGSGEWFTRVRSTGGKSTADAGAEESSEEMPAGEASWISRVLNKRKGKKNDPYDGINDFSEVAAVFDFYEDGKECAETGGHRHTRTSITCCATKLQEADGVGSSPLAILVSIQEVSICSYLVQVCSRLLCPELADGVPQAVGRQQALGTTGRVSTTPKESAVASMAPMAGGVLGILEELEACFPPKIETYWTYKLCFSTGISQYHGDIATKADGELITVVTTEFLLGKFDRSSVDGLGDGLIRKGEEGGKGAIVLEFTGGSECDLTGVLRSSTVFLMCGSIQAVQEVVEDRTCHYKIVAVSPLLCSHPALVPTEAPVRTVKCVADGGGKAARHLF